jgi:hypothetical protein
MLHLLLHATKVQAITFYLSIARERKLKHSEGEKESSEYTPSFMLATCGSSTTSSGAQKVQVSLSEYKIASSQVLDS